MKQFYLRRVWTQWTVFRIRDVLVRIRIRRSVPLFWFTDPSGSRACAFLQVYSFQDVKKNIFFANFCVCITYRGTCTVRQSPKITCYKEVIRLWKIFACCWKDPIRVRIPDRCKYCVSGSGRHKKLRIQDTEH
jgi:hypothetical protein